MQSTGYFQTEQQCSADLDLQKQRMRDLVKQAGQGQIEMLEGTCVDLDVTIVNNKKVQHGKYKHF